MQQDDRDTKAHKTSATPLDLIKQDRVNDHVDSITQKHDSRTHEIIRQRTKGN